MKRTLINAAVVFLSALTGPLHGAEPPENSQALTPEQIVQQQPRGKVTVRFRIETVGLHGWTEEDIEQEEKGMSEHGGDPPLRLEAGTKLAGGVKFYILLRGKEHDMAAEMVRPFAGKEDQETRCVVRLFRAHQKYFTGKVVEATGKIDRVKRARIEGIGSAAKGQEEKDFCITVEEADGFRVVPSSTGAGRSDESKPQRMVDTGYAAPSSAAGAAPTALAAQEKIGRTAVLIPVQVAEQSPKGKMTVEFWADRVSLEGWNECFRDGRLDEHKELLRLRGEVGALRNQLAEAQQRAATNGSRPAPDPTVASNRVAIVQASARRWYLNDWAQAFRDFALENNGQFPSSFAQAQANYENATRRPRPGQVGASPRSTAYFRALTPDEFEIVFQGSLSTLMDPTNTIVLRERQPRQLPDGRWAKIYGFADGSTLEHFESGGNFEEWEKAPKRPEKKPARRAPFIGLMRTPE